MVDDSVHMRGEKTRSRFVRIYLAVGQRHAFAIVCCSKKLERVGTIRFSGYKLRECKLR